MPLCGSAADAQSDPGAACNDLVMCSEYGVLDEACGCVPRIAGSVESDACSMVNCPAGQTPVASDQGCQCVESEEEDICGDGGTPFPTSMAGSLGPGPGTDCGQPSPEPLPTAVNGAAGYVNEPTIGSPLPAVEMQPSGQFGRTSGFRRR